MPSETILQGSTLAFNTTKVHRTSDMTKKIELINVEQDNFFVSLF